MPRGITRARLRTVMSHVRASVRRRARRVVLAVNPSAFSARTGSPADFAAWVERGMGRRTSGFPDSWKTRLDLPIETKARVGVIVHVYFPELLDEILRHLTAIPVTFDLIVTNASGQAITVDRSALPRLSSLVILDVENHGRDILPLVQVVNAGLLDPYQVILKVHTKRSEWRAGSRRADGDWRGMARPAAELSPGRRGQCRQHPERICDVVPPWPGHGRWQRSGS